MVNNITLIGNLGRDPELKTSQSGVAICKLNVATTSRTKRNGEWTDVTDWHPVVCFGRTAENVAQYLSKGSQVYVEGRVSRDSYEDKDGNKRYTADVIADNVRFLGGKGSSGGGSSSGGGYSGGNRGGSSGGYSGGNNNSQTSNDMPYSDGGDIPF